MKINETETCAGRKIATPREERQIVATSPTGPPPATGDVVMLAARGDTIRRVRYPYAVLAVTSRLHSKRCDDDDCPDCRDNRYGRVYRYSVVRLAETPEDVAQRDAIIAAIPPVDPYL